MNSASTTGVAEAPARQGRRLGLLFWTAIGWMIFVFAVAIFADMLPLPSPTDMDMLEKRAPFSEPTGSELIGSAATNSPA